MNNIASLSAFLGVYSVAFFLFSDEPEIEKNKEKPTWYYDCMYSSDVLLIAKPDKISYSEPKEIIAQISHKNSKITYLYKVDIEVEKFIYISRDVYISGQIAPSGSKINLDKTKKLSCFIQTETKIDENTNSPTKITDIQNEEVIVLLSFKPGICASDGPDMAFDGILNITNLDSVNKLIKERVDSEAKWNGGH